MQDIFLSFIREVTCRGRFVLLFYEEIYNKGLRGTLTFSVKNWSSRTQRIIFLSPKNSYSPHPTFTSNYDFFVFDNQSRFRMM